MVSLQLKDEVRSTLSPHFSDMDWWDERVHEAIKDGFLDPKNYLESAHECFVEQLLGNETAAVDRVSEKS